MSKIQELLKTINEADVKISPRALPANILKTILTIDPQFIEDGYSVTIDTNTFVIETSVICDPTVLKLLLKNKDFKHIDSGEDGVVNLVFNKV